MADNDEKNGLPEGISEAELEARVNAALETKKDKLKRKQRRSLIGTAVTVVIEILVALVLVVMVATTASGERFWYFGQFSFSVVITNSMEPEINVGDFIIIKKCSIEDIEEGDDIVFAAGSSFGSIEGQGVVHRAVEIHNDDGTISIETQGVNPSATRDRERVTAENLIGKCVFVSGFIGAIYGFLSNIINWVFIVVLGIVIWFAWSRISRLLKSAKAEKTEKADDINKNEE